MILRQVPFFLWTLTLLGSGEATPDPQAPAPAGAAAAPAPAGASPVIPPPPPPPPPAAGAPTAPINPPPPPPRVTPPPAPRKMIEIHLSLEEAIRWAVQRNLDVLSGNIDVDISNRELILARATFDPFFDVSFNYIKNRDPSVSRIDVGATPGVTISPTDVGTFKSGVRGLSPIGTTYEFDFIENRFNAPSRVASGFQVFNPTYSTSALVTLTQPLLKNGWYSVNNAKIRIATNDIQISREKLELILINTVYNVETSYWDVVFSQKNFLAKVKALQVTQENLRIDQKKVEVGTKAKIDLTTDESQVARRKTEHDQAAQLLEDSRDALLQQMNYVGTEESLKEVSERVGGPYRKYSDIILIPTSEPDSNSVTPERTDAIRLAFVRRVEFHQAELQIQNQDIQVSVAQNQLLPSLDVTGSWNQLGLAMHFDDSVNSMTDRQYYDWTLGATFEIPLSQRGPRASYRNAQDLRHRLLLQKQGLENSIVLEVDKALRNLDYSFRAVENLRKQVDLQLELLRAERVKLEVGKSIAYNVALIENDLVTFEAQLLRAMADYQNSKAAYEKAVGNLLQKHAVSLGD